MKIPALLSEYLDAELPAETCGEIQAHLAQCPSCSELLKTLKATVQLCHELPRLQPDRALSESARAQLRTAYGQMLAARA